MEALVLAVCPTRRHQHCMYPVPFSGVQQRQGRRLLVRPGGGRCVMQADCDHVEGRRGG